MPKVKGQAQMAGLAYERKVVGSLVDSLIVSDLGFDVAHNPWFHYTGTYGSGYCVPDAIVSVQSGEYKDMIFALEVKLTYTEDAIEKLIDLYCPVIAKAFDKPVVPVVICKNLVPGAPRALPTFFGAVEAAKMGAFSFPLIHWLGSSRLRLGLSETVEQPKIVIRSLR